MFIFFAQKRKLFSAGPQKWGTTGQLPSPEILKTWLLVKYNNKLQSFYPPKVVHQHVTINSPPENVSWLQLWFSASRGSLGSS